MSNGSDSDVSLDVDGQSDAAQNTGCGEEQLRHVVVQDVLLVRMVDKSMLQLFELFRARRQSVKKAEKALAKRASDW